jgi:SagB-type dehydrogenase family enzyme
MTYPYALSLKKSVAVHTDGPDLLLAGSNAKGMRLASPLPAQKNILANLTGGGLTAEQLVEEAHRTDQDAGMARLYYLLAILEQKKWLCYTLAPGGQKLATLEPVSEAFALHDSPVQGYYRLSRFACLRRLDRETVLESPLGHGRLLLHRGPAAALVAFLAEPQSAADLARALPYAGTPDIVAFINLLLSAGVLFPCDGEGRIAEGGNLPLRQWEFHDLLFHSRSRAGRHDNIQGGAFPFLGEISPLPGLKPPMSDKRIALYQPTHAELEAMGSNFFSVLDARRSLRERGAQPLSAKQLGIFLYCTGRIQQHLPANPEQGHHYEASLRPCAAGGAIHELEYYLTVSRCRDIEPGFYHYDPQDHVLEYLGSLGTPQEQLLTDARMAMGGKDFDLLITLAARFQRIAWKYRSLAYALIMKNVGSIYQQMYLVATALHLAPCALGGAMRIILPRRRGWITIQKARWENSCSQAAKEAFKPVVPRPDEFF